MLGTCGKGVQFYCPSRTYPVITYGTHIFFFLGHSGSDETSNNTMAALLFHPPQYQCVICQHNASLYRALSNPSLFSRKPHSTSVATCVSTMTSTPATATASSSGQLRNKHSTVTSAKNDKKYEETIIATNHDTDPDEEVIKECEVVIIQRVLILSLVIKIFLKKES